MNLGTNPLKRAADFAWWVTQYGPTSEAEIAAEAEAAGVEVDAAALAALPSQSGGRLRDTQRGYAERVICRDCGEVVGWSHYPLCYACSITREY